MLANMSDQQVERLLRVAKTARGLRPFFGSARGMILLREEAYRRGIYLTHGDRAEVERQVDQVCSKFKDAAHER